MTLRGVELQPGTVVELALLDTLVYVRHVSLTGARVIFLDGDRAGREGIFSPFVSVARVVPHSELTPAQRGMLVARDREVQR